MSREFHSDEVFDLFDAYEPSQKPESEPSERPDLLELYTRRPRRIEPHAPKIDAWYWAFIIGFGSIIFMALVMCL